MARILTAAVALPILIALVVFPRLSLLFVALVILALVTGLYEFWFLARRRGAKPDIVIGFSGAAAIFTAFYLDALYLLLPVVLALVIAALIAAMLRGAPFDPMIPSAGSTVLGVLYVSLLGGHLISVRISFSPHRSTALLGFFFLVIMGSDTGAYYTGRSLGRHKLAPEVSPGKTWEGAAGGMAASLILALISHFWFFHELPLPVGLALAAVMNVLGVVGDLTESAMKRGAGAKDAASILPGHGGLLDRLDSLLFNAPVIYYFGHFYFG